MYVITYSLLYTYSVINVSVDTNATIMMMKVKMMKIDLRLANNMRYRKCKQ